MSIDAKTERRVLTADEAEVVASSHYPDICDLDRQALAGAAKRLRTLRNKARDTARRQRREMRGKAEPRGARPAGDNSGTEIKRRVLASALKRVNRELTRFDAAERKSAQAGLARRALEIKRANRKKHHPSAGRTAGAGMRANPSTAPTVQGDPREAGRVSQFVKNAQARRDG